MFNQHSDRFMLSHQETVGGRVHTSVAPFSSRGGSFQPSGFMGGGAGSAGGFGRGSGGGGGGRSHK